MNSVCEIDYFLRLRTLCSSYGKSHPCITAKGNTDCRHTKLPYSLRKIFTSTIFQEQNKSNMSSTSAQAHQQKAEEKAKFAAKELEDARNAMKEA